MRATNGPGNNKAKSELPTELMEQIVSRGNMIEAYMRVYNNRGSGGIDGRTVEELKPHLDKQLVRDQSVLVDRQLLPPTGADGRDTKAGRWSSDARHTDSGRPDDTTRHTPSTESILRRRIFGMELWFSSRAECPSGTTYSPGSY